MDNWKDLAKTNALPCYPGVLKQLRQRKGWTQIQLAKYSGYSLRLISKAEAGGPIALSTIEDLAEALSLDGRVVYPEDLVVDPHLKTRELIRLLQKSRFAVIDNMQHWLDADVELHIVGHREVKQCPQLTIGQSGVVAVLQFLWTEFGSEPLKLDDIHCVSSGSEVAVWCKLFDEPGSNPPVKGVQMGCLLEFQRGRIRRIELMLDAAAWLARMKARKSI